MDKVYVAILSFVFLFVFHYFLNHHKNKSRKLPPSPLSIPFIGHLHLLGKPLHVALSRLADRHGPVMLLRLGVHNTVVVSSAGRAKECFTDCDVALANRPRFPMQKLISFDYALLSLANYGPYWRNLRRDATVQLLSAHHVNCMSGVISGETRAMVRRLVRASTAAPDGVVRVELKRRLFELSLSVLMETIAQTKTTHSEGADADTDMSKEAQEFKEVLEELLPLLGAGNLFDLLPVLQWFDVYGVRRNIEATVKRRDTFIYGLIEAARKKQDGKNGEEDEKNQSMISVLLSLQKQDPEFYTDTTIAALVTILFGAGTETTSTTTEWAMSFLLNHPNVLKKAREEIDGHVGSSRPLNENDLPHLTYLHCIIKETLRLRPAAPMLLPHEAMTDCEIAGYRIPAGTILLVNVHAIHRDPTAWDEPTEFKPERFEDGKADGKFMIPFGMGRRKCPGENLALRTIGLVLGTLIQYFDWNTVGGAKVDMTEGPSAILLRAVPLEALCKPRADMSSLLQKI